MRKICVKCEVRLVDCNSELHCNRCWLEKRIGDGAVVASRMWILRRFAIFKIAFKSDGLISDEITKLSKEARFRY